MAMENLVRSVLRKDPASTLEAKKIGPAANRELVRLAGNADAKVRRIALYCLAETGGREAAAAFAEALLDPDAQVRGAALGGLRRRYQEASPGPLLQVYDRCQDSYARQQIMLVLARIERGVDAQQVKLQYDKETDPQAREGGLAALAQLGDAAARAEFTRRLRESSGQDRVRFLAYCEWLNNRWLLRPLLPLLSDTTPAVRVGVDARPDLIDSLRVCDLVVNLIGAVTQHKFSFPVNQATNYTVAQMEEVGTFVRSLPEARNP